MKRSVSLRGSAFRSWLSPGIAALWLALAASCVSSCSSRAPVDADVAFVHVTVVPMDTPRVLTDQTVLVKGTRILAVSPTGSTAVASRARVIDGTGKFLMPGLADMHVHAWMELDLALFVANGVTTVRNMWGASQHLAWQQASAKGTLFGPTVHTAGPLLDGEPPIWDSSTVVRNPAEATAAVRLGHARGYEFVKVYARLSRPAYDAVVAEAARLGIPVAGHVPGDVGLEHVLDSHQSSIEHLDGYFMASQRADSPALRGKDRAARLRVSDYVDDAKLAHWVERTRLAGTWNCPTLIVGRRFVPLDEARQLFARPEMQYVAPTTLASWDPTKDFRLKANTPDDFMALRRSDARKTRLVKQLHDAGARLLLGTDCPNPFVVPGFSVHEELVALVGAGLTPFEALRAGTKDAATYLGDDFGEVAPGKRADLILVAADPLEDVRNATHRVGVMVRGVWHPEPELRAALEAAVRSFDPAIDRLAGLPAFGPAGIRRTAPRRFRASSGAGFAGQERFAVETLPDGGRVLFAQAAYDDVAPGSAIVDLREEVDALGKLRSVVARRKNAGDDFTVHLEVRSGRLMGEAIMPAGETRRIDEPIGDALVLPGTVGISQLVIERARGLPVNGRLTVLFKDLQTEPSLQFVDVTAKVTRLGDVGSVRRYAVEERRVNGTSRWEATVGPDGFVRSVHAVMQMGDVDIVQEK